MLLLIDCIKPSVSRANIVSHCLKLMSCSEIKERVKKTKDEKKAKKAEVQAKLQKSQGKGAVSKGAAPKGPKLGGGGGKR